MTKALQPTFKVVLLPSEHGASIMLAESVVAGLWIGASAKGLVPALGWLFIFFMSQPLKIAAKDMTRGISTPRTRIALWGAAIMGILAAASMAWAYFLSHPAFLVILAGMALLGIIHAWAVIKGSKKEFTAELFGALSFGAGAASIVFVSGYSLGAALVLWLLLAARAVTSVVYVRQRLRQMRGEVSHFVEVLGVHILALALFFVLVVLHLIKPVILWAGFLLSLRLCRLHRNPAVSSRKLGIQETILGVLFVILTVLAF